MEKRAILIDYIIAQIETLGMWDKQFRGLVTHDYENEEMSLTLGDKAGEAAWVDNYENDLGVCLHAQTLIVSRKGTNRLVENGNELPLTQCKPIALTRLAIFIHEFFIGLLNKKRIFPKFYPKCIECPLRKYAYHCATKTPQ